MKKRNLAVIFLLFIITIGIYPLIWDYFVVKDLNKNENTKPDVNNIIITILFSIITLGIYYFYRQFILFKKIDAYFKTNHLIINFVCTFILCFVPMLIIQNEINKMSA